MTPPESEIRPAPLRLLFVCSGNTCRSPLAEVLAKAMGPEYDLDSLEIRSAGTHAGPGFPASEGAQTAAQRHGYSLAQHRSTPLTQEVVEWADLILAMGPGHLRRIQELGGDGKAALLGAFAHGLGLEGGGEDWAIPDPYGGSDEVYETTLLTLKEYLRLALERLAGRFRT